MGIQGLLPLLKDIQVKTSISSFSGLTVGIDAYCWLHKGAYGCAKDLIFQKSTRIYINYVMRRVDMLISHNVTPILVFDGGHLPAKAETEKGRRSRKKQYRERGMAALKEGNTKEAYECFQRCYDITPVMAGEVIDECFAMNVQCIVAPYEADAQLAYLMKEGITQLTISEDSDLLLYGCNKVMYKMSIDGEGLVIDLANLSNVKTVQLASFTVEKFRHMCMLSGCDYLSSIKGMGLIKSFKSIRRFSTVFQCIKSLKCDSTYNVPKDYEENFRKADLVFKYQLVFDIRTKRLIRLNEINELDEFGDAEKEFAGPQLDASKGLQIALGNIDPIGGKILAHRKDFASGHITNEFKKSTSWDNTIGNIPPVANKNTAFQFNRKSQQLSFDLTPTNNQTSNKPAENTVVSETTNASSQARSHIVVPSPQEANKSLKRLRDDEISVPTREEKIRKLYKEEVEIPEIKNETPDNSQSADSTHRHHYNVFSNKSRKFKNPFKQINHAPSEKVVISRFFENKIGPAKENTVLQVDTPSPEKIITSITNEPTTTPQQGSFLNYLDKTNLRGYEVKVLTLSPQKSSKQGKNEKSCSPKKSKRMNMFSLTKNETNKSSPVICPRKNPTADKIDFNITIPLDGATLVEKNLKSDFCRSNTKSTPLNLNKMFSHFEHKPKINTCLERLKSDDVVNIILNGNDEINSGDSEIERSSHMDTELVEVHTSVSNPQGNVCENENIQSTSCINKKRNLKLGLCKSSAKGSLSSWTNKFSNFEHKTKHCVSEQSNINGLDGIKNFATENCVKNNDCNVNKVVYLEEESVKLRIDDSEHAPNGSNRNKVSCVNERTNGVGDSLAPPQSEVDVHPDLLFNIGTNKEGLRNTIEEKDTPLDIQLITENNEDLLFSPKKPEITDICETVALDEEPLPFDLEYNVKFGTETTDKLCEENGDNKVIDVDYLDEEPLPFHSEKNMAIDLVNSSTLPSKHISKRCKPIGLSRKQKCLDKKLSGDKLKQATFDKFAFKKKSIRRSDGEDIICLS